MAVKQLSDGSTDGTKLGQSATDLVGLWGVTPVAQPSGAAQAALTDNSGGTAADTIASIGAAYSQTEVRNAVASLAAKINTLRSALVTAGVIKGSA